MQNPPNATAIICFEDTTHKFVMQMPNWLFDVAATILQVSHTRSEPVKSPYELVELIEDYYDHIDQRISIREHIFIEEASKMIDSELLVRVKMALSCEEFLPTREHLLNGYTECSFASVCGNLK